MAGDDDEVTPAGWYRQPDDPDLLRWWDGDDWTDDTMPVPERAARKASGTKAAGKPTGASKATKSARTATKSPGTATTAAARRTRADAMAEAEAIRRGDPVPAAEIPVEAPPVQVEAPRQPEPTAPEAAAEPAPRRRSRPPSPAAPARTTPETVRVLEPDGPDEDWMVEAWAAEAAATAPARRRPSRPDAARPPQVQRPTRPRPQGAPPSRQEPARRPRPAAGPRPAGPARPAPSRPRVPADHRPSRMASGPSPATAQTMLRILVRAGLIAVVIALVVVGYLRFRDAAPDDADTLSKDPAAVTVDPDAARLDQIILTLADLPRGWQQSEAAGSSGDLCEGRVPESVIEPTASQTAAFSFGDRGIVIGNTVHEFANDDSAEAFVDLSARVLDSCRDRSQEGSSSHLVPIDFPRFGDQTFAAEVTGEGPNGSLHGAVVYVRRDNRVASVVSFSVGNPLDRDLVEHLVDLVNRRMGSSSPASDDLPGDSGSTGELPGG